MDRASSSFFRRAADRASGAGAADRASGAGATGRASGASALAIAAVAFALAGCTTRVPPTQTGELSGGTFTYECVGSSDAFCDEGAVLPEGFPPVALLSEFTALFTADTAASDGSLPYIDTVAPERISIVGDLLADPPTLRAMETGYSALIARDGVSARDFLHVLVEPVDAVEIFYVGDKENASGTVGMPDFTLKVGSSEKLRAVLKNAKGDLLAGSLPTAWSSTKPAVAALVTSPSDNYVRVEAKSAGTTTMTVTMSEFQIQFPITVGSP
jgi:hypothetical protein